MIKQHEFHKISGVNSCALEGKAFPRRHFQQFSALTWQLVLLVEFYYAQQFPEREILHTLLKLILLKFCRQ